MEIVCIGGGPAGLNFALLMTKQEASHDLPVVDRNRPYDTFGWGVVISDATIDRKVTCADQYQDADLTVASEGINSRIRNQHAAVVRPEIVDRGGRAGGSRAGSRLAPGTSTGVAS